jgi:hypothetical protein
LKPSRSNRRRKAQRTASLLRGLALAIAAALVAAVAWDLLQPQPALQPGAEPSVTTADSDREAFRAAQADGRIREDPVRAPLRRDVLRSAAALDDTPCDAAAQAAFADAAVAFLRAKLDERTGGPAEVVSVDGRDIDVTAFLDEAPLLAITAAIRQGDLRVDALPADLDPLKPIFSQVQPDSPRCDS